ncbi:MAG TPA: hypothetical protein VLA36_05055 [Longimicrobiales bacterium]|nr:hypothetical protein [Longimicrobiales bacterium]
MSKHTSFGLKALTFGMALAAFAAPRPAAGQAVDARWLPWMGCWEATSNEVANGDLLCVRPAAQAGGMEFLRISEDAVVAREVVWADGQRHETTRESCSGWEQGSFSEDGRRLFLSSTYTCDGGALQEGGGIIAMASPAAFVDVRVAGMGGERLAWVQRYHAATEAQAEAAGFGDILADRAWSVGQARMIAAAPLDVDDVIEASTVVPSEAVEALLVERGDRMDLKAAELIQLAEAGVPDNVIDVAVATAYPESFRLASGAGGQAGSMSALDQGSLRRRWGTSSARAFNPYDPRFGAYGGSLYYGYRYSPFGYQYNPYLYGYGYGAYGYGGYGYGGYRPVVVEVDRAGTAPAPRGRVVNGRGYSRGSGSSGTPSQGYVPRSTGASGSPSAGSSGSGSGSSSGTSTGRTAKPRGGGN